MPDHTDPVEDSTDSAAYRWTIRALYATAIAMNIYIAWASSRDEVEMAIVRAKLATLADRLREPARRRREWIRAVGKMHGQAMEIVPDAYQEATDG